MMMMMMMMERLFSSKEESPPVPFFNFTATPSDRFLFVFISLSTAWPGGSCCKVWLTLTVSFLLLPLDSGLNRICPVLILRYCQHPQLISFSFFFSFFAFDPAWVMGSGLSAILSFISISSSGSECSLSFSALLLSLSRPFCALSKGNKALKVNNQNLVSFVSLCWMCAIC